MTVFTPDQWLIVGLVFLLGLLVGAFMTAGGRRKWKTRYNDEHRRYGELEKQHKEREGEHASREKELRERDSLRDASARNAPRGDADRDGVPDRSDRRPTDDRRA
ncbi:MAG: hypothetical protein M3Q52_03035 [Pseudomonadota bacterium]|nr:hypothetical protein [Pseudomonadota bacterium]